jgi:O-antigen ligase
LTRVPLDLAALQSLPKPRHSLEARIATASAIFAAVLFLSNWPVYAYVVLGGRVPLIYFMLTVALAAGVGSSWLWSGSAALQRILLEPVIWWFVGFVLLSLIWMNFSFGDPGFLNLFWRGRLLSMMFFVAIFILVAAAVRQWVAAAIGATLVATIPMLWFDLLNPGFFVPFHIEGSNPGRAAAFYINANGAGAFIVLATAAVLPFVPMRFRALLFLGMLLGVLPTISRTALIFAALMIALAVPLRLLDRKQILLLLTMLPILISALTVVYAILLTLPGVDVTNITGRLEWFVSGGREVDFSHDERAFVAAQALEMFTSNPLFGEGFAATFRAYEAGPHNMYLMLAAEQGIVGLGLFLLLLGILVTRALATMRSAGEDTQTADEGRALLILALFLMFFSLLSHNVLDAPFLLYFIAYALVPNLPRSLRPASPPPPIGDLSFGGDQHISSFR